MFSAAFFVRVLSSSQDPSSALLPLLLAGISGRVDGLWWQWNRQRVKRGLDWRDLRPFILANRFNELHCRIREKVIVGGPEDSFTVERFFLSISPHSAVWPLEPPTPESLSRRRGVSSVVSEFGPRMSRASRSADYPTTLTVTARGSCASLTKGNRELASLIARNVRGHDISAMIGYAGVVKDDNTVGLGTFSPIEQCPLGKVGQRTKRLTDLAPIVMGPNEYLSVLATRLGLDAAAGSQDPTLVLQLAPEHQAMKADVTDLLSR